MPEATPLVSSVMPMADGAARMVVPQFDIFCGRIIHRIARSISLRLWTKKTPSNYRSWRSLGELDVRQPSSSAVSLRRLG